MAKPHAVAIGKGEAVVLVHGDGPVESSAEPWKEQEELADEFQLTFLNRTGFASDPSSGHGSYLDDAKAILDSLADGAHLVGHSGGGLACLLAATECPTALRSLTVIEPGVVSHVRGEPLVERLIARAQRAYEDAKTSSPATYWAEVSSMLGMEVPPDTAFSASQLISLRACMTMKPRFYEVQVPLDRLSAAACPKLIVSGAWDNAPASLKTEVGSSFALICDVLARAIGGNRCTIRGASHSPQWENPRRFNEVLRAFLRSAE